MLLLSNDASAEPRMQIDDTPKSQMGSEDTYFLNYAVYLIEDFLKQTGPPGHGVPYEGEVRYGPRAEHCWNGDPTQPNWYSRLHYNQLYVPQILKRIQETAPQART